MPALTLVEDAGGIPFLRSAANKGDESREELLEVELEVRTRVGCPGADGEKDAGI